MDDLLTEFLTETSENLAVLDVELIRFEQNPDDAATLGSIFRLVHTIKGTCGFLGLPRLESVAHAGENVLGRFRDGELAVSAAAVTLILECIDRIRTLLGDLSEHGVEQPGDDSGLIARLNAMAESGALAAPAAAEPQPANDMPFFADEGFPVAAELLLEVEQALEGGAAQAPVEPIAPAVRASGTVAEKSAPSEARDADSGKPSATIRVNVEVLESLMTLVSELVLTRNQLQQMVRGQEDSEFKAPLQRVSLITSELQEGIMKTRMQPISNAWSKLPRIVRDLSVESGKRIDLVMEGAETELDRQVLELIKDPLTHMVRNSADHGLETPRERRAVGKPETGIITLRAYHEGGHIIILIADDGRGLNGEKIRAKVLANGLATPAELAGMSEQQVMQFIFRAGFSTAEKVTNVSGRGVGMDVVRTNIEKIGGTIELKSTEGRGTSFVIKIPLTLAIVSALVVESGAQRFAIPQINVLELINVSPSSESRVEIIRSAPVLRLRDQLLPLVSLRSLFALGPESATSEDMLIVITQVGTQIFGIIVDRVFDTEEIVVKPMSPVLRDIDYYSGNTIMGDGGVIMILDPNGIASAIGQHPQASEPDAATAANERLRQDASRMSFLVFRAGGGDLKAVPLDLVTRLEEFEVGKIETAGDQHVVQYRGQLVPLMPFNGSHQWRSEGMQPALMFADGPRMMGLVVDEIVDVVEDVLDIQLATVSPGYLGSAVIAGRATDIIDASYFLTQALPSWFRKEQGGERGASSSHSVLLVDDSAFFRSLMSPVLSAAGWRVTAVEGVTEARRMLDTGHIFDAIVSDIEMPGMNGLEFASALRSDSRWAGMPLIALSSLARESDVAAGRKAGFDEYISKANRQGLLAALDRLTGRHGGAGGADATDLVRAA